MPHFIFLQRYTEQGRKSMRETPGNIKRNVQNLSGAGTTTQGVYLTMGAYDIVAIVELPNDEAALELSARLAEQGNAESTVMRAFTLDEGEQALAQ